MAKMNITFKGETKSVNFTEPQARIAERLLRGDRATWINLHHRDGGDFVWYDKDGYGWGATCVGWKAFNGAMLAIQRTFGLDYKQYNELVDSFIIYNNNLQ